MLDKVKVGELKSYANARFYREDMNKMINLYWLGTEFAAEERNGKIELLDHPNMGNVKEAQYNICQNITFGIVVDLYSDGSKGNIRIDDNSLTSGIVDITSVQ